MSARSTLILTIMGPDRPGLVAALSRTLADYDAEWTDSRMSCLGNQFAGIVLIHVADDKVVALEHELGELRNQGLRVGIDTGGAPQSAPRRTVRLTLTAPRSSNTVASLARELAAADVNVEEFQTRAEHAAWSREGLCHVEAVVSLRPEFDVRALLARLESLAARQRAEIAIHEVTHARAS
jgi:glycine cleavage system regulatory protein